MKKIILAIGAHPDDIEIGCGGTLAILHQKGHQLVHLIITSGEEGSFTKTKSETTKAREIESNNSGKSLGATQVIFFRAEDGLTSFSKSEKTRLIAILRELRPEIIFTHASSDKFPDHSIVHQLTRAAVLGAAGPWYPEAGGQAHKVSSIYGYEVWNPIEDFQLAIDISSTLGQKLEALSKHESQIKEINYLEAVRGLASYRGVTSMAGTFAEVFEVLKISEIK